MRDTYKIVTARNRRLDHKIILHPAIIIAREHVAVDPRVGVRCLEGVLLDQWFLFSLASAFSDLNFVQYTNSS